MFKKLCSLIMLVLCSVFILSGCASVNYSISILSNGTVEQGFVVNLDEQALADAGKNLSEVKTLISDNIDELITDAFNNFAQRDLSLEIKQQVVQNIEILKNYPSAASIAVTLKFSSVTVYRYFYGTLPEPEDAEDTTLTESYLFYSKYINESQTIYYDLEDSLMVQSWLTYFSESGLNLSDVQYSFSYGTPLSHLYSDADEITYDNGIKIHTWNFDYDELNNSITTYTIGIKTASWYILALCLTAVFVNVLLVINLIKKRKFKKKVLLVK